MEITKAWLLQWREYFQNGMQGSAVPQIVDYNSRAISVIDELLALRELSRREEEAGSVVAVIDGHFPELAPGTTVFAEDLEHFTDDPHHDTIPVTVTIRRRAGLAKG